MGSKSWIDAEPDVPCQCENCDWTGTASELKPIADLEQRVAAGEIMPAGECPECGALAHYKDEEAPEWSAQRQLHELRKNVDPAKRMQMIARVIAELEYVRSTCDIRDSLRNEPNLAAEARRMFDLPVGAILPDGTRTDQWDDRLRRVDATPIYSRDE
jgi:uncharacterized Zn finger protein (UPF0148 family)